MTVADQLCEAASQIRHIGDYGFLYWHEGRGHVWWTVADGDSPMYGSTPDWEIEQLFARIPEVNIIHVMDECVPADCTNERTPSNGWARLLYDARIIPSDFEPDDDDYRRIEAQWTAAEDAWHAQHPRTCEAWVRPGHEQACEAWAASLEA